MIYFLFIFSHTKNINQCKVRLSFFLVSSKKNVIACGTSIFYILGILFFANLHLFCFSLFLNENNFFEYFIFYKK